jgi:hypothetical protein
MPPKITRDVISDTTDPTTKRPDFLPVQKTKNQFLGLDLPDFPPQINLPRDILPINPWSIFRLFITIEIVVIIMARTNERASQL